MTEPGFESVSGCKNYQSVTFPSGSEGQAVYVDLHQCGCAF